MINIELPKISPIILALSYTILFYIKNTILHYLSILQEGGHTGERRYAGKNLQREKSEIYKL